MNSKNSSEQYIKLIENLGGVTIKLNSDYGTLINPLEIDEYFEIGDYLPEPDVDSKDK